MIGIFVIFCLWPIKDIVDCRQMRYNQENHLGWGQSADEIGRIDQ